MEYEKLDFSRVSFYLLSDELYEPKHAPLAVAVMLTIIGSDGSFRKGDVMGHMTGLIRDGRPFNGPDGYEIGRWDNRFSDVESTQPTSDDMYYAWVDPDHWDYDPHCVLYTKEEFMIKLYLPVLHKVQETNTEQVLEISENSIKINGVSQTLS